ncbi:MAG: histidine phosphatase family protein, partial [Deltaproteobacteria bacterium]|nr:histidine phosphatase family protein [Deltaproteobacteria bacterium]
MRLILVRHGIAVDRADPGCPANDAERRLTDAGREKTKRAARGLRKLDARPGALFSSPYLRAVETAELFRRALELPSGSIRRTEALLPGADPAAFLEELARTEADEVLAFGHAPSLDRIVAAVLGTRGPRTEMGKAGAACLDLPPGEA